jgi:hypothetical protein
MLSSLGVGGGRNNLERRQRVVKTSHRRRCWNSELFVPFVYLVFFGQGLCCVAQAGFELLILLSQATKSGWNVLLTERGGGRGAGRKTKEAED